MCSEWGLRSFCVNARGMQVTGDSTGAWNVCVEARPHLIVNADGCRVRLWAWVGMRPFDVRTGSGGGLSMMRGIAGLANRRSHAMLRCSEPRM